MTDFISAARTLKPDDLGTPEVWQLASSLRWNGAVLEQAWQSLTTGNVKWVPVPHIPSPLKDPQP